MKRTSQITFPYQSNITLSRLEVAFRDAPLSRHLASRNRPFYFLDPLEPEYSPNRELALSDAGKQEAHLLPQPAFLSRLASSLANFSDTPELGKPDHLLRRCSSWTRRLDFGKEGLPRHRIPHARRGSQPNQDVRYFGSKASALCSSALAASALRLPSSQIPARRRMAAAASFFCSAG